MKQDDDAAFMAKLASLTFGFGSKPPQAKQVKFTCPARHEHTGTLVGPITIPFKDLPPAIKAEIKKRTQKPKANDEQSFSA